MLVDVGGESSNLIMMIIYRKQVNYCLQVINYSSFNIGNVLKLNHGGFVVVHEDST